MSLKNRYDNVIIRNNLSLGLSHNALDYVLKLEKENRKLKKQYCERTDCGGRLGNSKKVEELIKENERLKEENFNLREGIYIEKMSFSSEGRNFKELIEMPTYKQLQNNWNELKKWLKIQITADKSYVDLVTHCLSIQDLIEEKESILSKMQELERGE